MPHFQLDNASARALFIDRHLLGLLPQLPAGDDGVLALIRKLGFVQLDSINTVERAHHVILFTRMESYDRESLHRLLARRALFEHFTHDASLIPAEFYPHWHHRFRAARERLKHPAWQRRIGPEPEKAIARVRRRLAKGPVSTRHFEDKGEGAWWGWGPSKTALEFLFRTGELAIARRDGFVRIYDRASRVVPDELRRARPTRRQTIDWAMREALARLGFAGPSELAGFFDLIEIAEARAWAKSALRRKEIVEINVESADGRVTPALAFPSIETEAAALAPVPPQTRFLSPFDPLLRDRKRTRRLFGFDYTIEVFVPGHKRRYGYYVLPILEGGRLVGRADLKTHREQGRIEMKGLWLEPGIARSRARIFAIDAALASLTRFVCPQ
ncbi:MAG: YcaQ family DNA glycosylase [Alphaproteobacteria bacterium]|nr:YcaQ family DNA glycosylase [Alphaproteobacteria bacterium]